MRPQLGRRLHWVCLSSFSRSRSRRCTAWGFSHFSQVCYGTHTGDIKRSWQRSRSWTTLALPRRHSEQQPMQTDGVLLPGTLGGATIVLLLPQPSTSGQAGIKTMETTEVHRPEGCFRCLNYDHLQQPLARHTVSCAPTAPDLPTPTAQLPTSDTIHYRVVPCKTTHLPSGRR